MLNLLNIIELVLGGKDYVYLVLQLFVICVLGVRLLMMTFCVSNLGLIEAKASSNLVD